MIELILSTLAEFGLIREDYKHRKRILKKEKEDGIKRPIQKVFLQPGTIIAIAVLFIGILSGLIFFSYQGNSIYSQNTEKEISEISERMEDWNEKFGEYPSELNNLIGNSPIRQDWSTDEWNRPYKYEVLENGKKFLIISSGSDGKFGTEDDIKSK